MNPVEAVIRQWRAFTTFGIPALLVALDSAVRDGFGLGFRDVGADMALIGATALFTMAIDETDDALRRNALLGLALLDAVLWVATLWCLNHPGDGWARGAGAIGILAAALAFRSLIDERSARLV